MFGYLRVDGAHGRTVLAPAQCGLCGHYGASFRTRTRWLAGFDPSVLLLALDGLTPGGAPRVRVRCPIPLARRRSAIDTSWAGTRAVAAVQLFLAGEKLFDDRMDRDSPWARAAASLLRKDIVQAETWLEQEGFPLVAVRNHLRRQSVLEADPGADLDALSLPTALGLAEVSAWCGHYADLGAERVAALKLFGDRLGRALYLVDALNDLQGDRCKGTFNPIVSAAGGARSPAMVHFIGGVLRGRLSALSAALDGLALERHAEVLTEATLGALREKGRDALDRMHDGMVGLTLEVAR